MGSTLDFLGDRGLLGGCCRFSLPRDVKPPPMPRIAGLDTAFGLALRCVMMYASSVTRSAPTTTDPATMPVTAPLDKPLDAITVAFHVEFDSVGVTVRVTLTDDARLIVDEGDAPMDNDAVALAVSETVADGLWLGVTVADGVMLCVAVAVSVALGVMDAACT